MAAIQMYPSVLRQAKQLVGNSVAVPATASRKYIILSDVGSTDLADPTLYVKMRIDVEDASVVDPDPVLNGWRVGGGGGCTFQCGPYTEKDGTLLPGGKNRGFQVDAALLAGKNVRLVAECRTVPAGTDNQTAIGNWENWPYRATVIGCTREAVG